MRISEAIEDIASTVGPVFYGEAVTAGAKSITDTSILADGGQFIGGMLIITSGEARGNLRRVVSNKDGVITVDRDFSYTPDSCDTFIVSPLHYHRLLQAFSAAANSGSAILTDDTLVGVDGQLLYALPDGVSNVVRVELENRGYNRFWREFGGNLRFSRGHSPAEGVKITLYYRGRVALDWAKDLITTSVNPDWMKWAGVAQFWRTELEISHKDNPVAVDMMNEARTQLAQATARVNSMDMAPDPRYFAT